MAGGGHQPGAAVLLRASQDVAGDRESLKTELLYNASVLAHFATTSTAASISSRPSPTSLSTVFDVFVLDRSQHADPGHPGSGRIAVPAADRASFATSCGTATTSSGTRARRRASTRRAAAARQRSSARRDDAGDGEALRLLVRSAGAAGARAQGQRRCCCTSTSSRRRRILKSEHASSRGRPFRRRHPGT